MANIKLQDLTSIAGSDLFNDSESFIQDLSDLELTVQGGATPLFWVAVIAIGEAGIMAAAGGWFGDKII